MILVQKNKALKKVKRYKHYVIMYKRRRIFIERIIFLLMLMRLQSTEIQDFMEDYSLNF